ncbi:MAG: DUF4856 domain-containing protein [Bacteroidota bacterium]
MKNQFLYLLAILAVLGFSACDDDDAGPMIDVPQTYEFARDGATTVSFSGQTDRIMMGEELISGMKDFSVTVEALQNMYVNPEGVDPFSNADLNASTKSVRGKTAASADYFSSNATGSAIIKEAFDAWIAAQVNEVAPAENVLAEAGVAGQIADGGSVRYVNSQGLEYNQLVNKGLIGALMADQALNNYLSPAVLDAASNIDENDNGTVADGKNYTNMEHKWDEAYGYLYGTAANTADPNPTIGDDDSFLNKYIGRVEGDPDFMGIADDIYEALKLGRAAIVAGDYKTRDEQAEIVREKVSTVIAVRAVYYLQQGKAGLETEPVNLGGVFHDLSEGYGFIYSLQFTRKPNTSEPYFSGTEVDAMLTDLLNDGANGLWDVTPATLQSLSEQIAAEFDFTVDQAGS